MVRDSRWIYDLTTRELRPFPDGLQLMSEPSDRERVQEVRVKLVEICETLTALMRSGIQVNFAVNTDVANQMVSLARFEALAPMRLDN